MVRAHAVSQQERATHTFLGHEFGVYCMINYVVELPSRQLSVCVWSEL